MQPNILNLKKLKKDVLLSDKLGYIKLSYWDKLFFRNIKETVKLYKLRSKLSKYGYKLSIKLIDNSKKKNADNQK